MKKVVIMGAGPAGLAAAHTLAGKADIHLIDQGKRVEKRGKSSFDRSYGFGGIGPYTDGKFIFDKVIGKRQVGTNLHEIVGKRKEISNLKKAKEIFISFYNCVYEEKLQEEIPQERLKRAQEITSIAARNDMDYIVAHDYHIGTDRLPELIRAIQDDLEDKGVDIITSEKIIDFDKNYVYSKKNKYKYDSLLIAPGRDGSIWLQKKLTEKNIEHSSRPTDFGFRIETDAKIIEHLTNIERDVKFEFRHPNGDLIRTFCVSPYGKVVVEEKKPEYMDLDFSLVNGASESKPLSDNTNFALLVRMPLREGGDNAAWAVKLAEAYKLAGVNRIVLQRYGDLIQERSSKPNKMKEWRIQPTLDKKHYMVGDVRTAMYSRIMDDIRYGIKKLSAPGLMEGLDQDSTLLYGPEVKMHGIKIATDKYLQSTSMPNIYFAGDGTGISRGIGGAMASGILAAEGILKNL